MMHVRAKFANMVGILLCIGIYIYSLPVGCSRYGVIKAGKVKNSARSKSD